jgi:hypothetical protein
LIAILSPSQWMAAYEQRQPLPLSEVYGEQSRPIEKQVVPGGDYQRREDHQYHWPEESWWTHPRVEGANTGRFQAGRTRDSQIGRIDSTVRFIK